MQDIDFDEIDRAVNSITNSSTDAQINSTPVAHATPEVSVSPASSPLPTPAPSPAARRSSGRFMDVVHPSSDMRPPTLDRSAPAVIPAPEVQHEEVAEKNEVADRPEPAATQPQGSAFHWPDPIDMSSSTPTPESQPTEQLTEIVEPSLPEPTPEVTEEPPIIPEPDEEKNELDVTPLESPFLTDTKVEKRPLGAFSGADAGLPLLEDPIPSSTDTSFSSAPAVPVEEPAHEEHDEVPHELHEDLLALDGHGQDETQAEPVVETPVSTEPTPEPAPEPVVTAPVEDIPVGPTSITQQYKEQPSSDPQTSGSIFDTEAYHQALTHPPKKRSSVLIIVWILALILVGGGIGVGIYFFVLPMLG